MSNSNKPDRDLAAIVIRLTQIIIVLVIFIIALVIALAKFIPAPKPEPVVEAPLPDAFGNFTEAGRQSTEQRLKDTVNYWKAPDESSLDGNSKKESILYGKDLIAHTSVYFGENGKIYNSTN